MANEETAILNTTHSVLSDFSLGLDQAGQGMLRAVEKATYLVKTGTVVLFNWLM